MKTIEYNSESQLRSPLRLLRNMIKDLYLSKDLALRLMRRDINSNYRQTILGYFWAFIPSIVVAYGLVAANDSKVINIESTNLPYPAYVMLSMVLWQTFLESLNSPMQAILESRTMLAKINFPREAIIISKIGEVVFNFMIKMVLVALIYYFYEMPITKMALIAPFGVISLIILGTFIGLFFAPLGAVVQDFNKGMTVLTTIWLFITPVLFPVPQGGVFAKIIKFNPVTSILVTTRELATTGVVTDWQSFGLTTTFAILGLFFTWIFFRITIPYVIERIPS